MHRILRSIKRSKVSARDADADHRQTWRHGLNQAQQGGGELTLGNVSV
jgi:hypothetical protein